MTAAVIGRRARVTGDLFHGQVPADAVYVGRAAPGLAAKDTTTVVETLTDSAKEGLEQQPYRILRSAPEGWSDLFR